MMFTCFSHWRMIDFCSFPHLAQAVLNLPTFSSHNCCLRTVLDGLQPRMQAHKRECRTWLFGYCDSLMRPLIVTSTANLWTALAFSQDRFTFAAPWRNRGKGGTWTTLQSQCTRCCPGLGRALTTSYEKQLYGRILPVKSHGRHYLNSFHIFQFILTISTVELNRLEIVHWGVVCQTRRISLGPWSNRRRSRWTGCGIWFLGAARLAPLGMRGD